jgi:predicted transcriptional regulator
MKETKKVCDLLFELSSSGRMDILLEIQKQSLILSHISKKLNMTAAETYRHLQRLSEAKLVEKDIDSSYHLTPFGELTLSLLTSIDFISKQRRYFLEHVVSRLPHEFISRIGELSAGILDTDVMVNIHRSEIMYQEAQEYIWLLADQILMSGVPIVEERVKHGVEVRAILPENIIPPPDYKRPQLDMVAARRYKGRFIGKVEAIIVMTERKAIFCLPDLSGKMDYTGFFSDDPRFHKWCRELYLYYWDKGKPYLSLDRQI